MVAAERLSAAGWKCVVADRRETLGGNAHDGHDKAGVLFHKFGPHYFRTNSPRIVDYLSQFTEWHNVDYIIKSSTRGRLWSFPINLNTFEEFSGKTSSSEEFQQWLEKHRLPISKPQNSEEVITSQVGVEFYKLFFENYTLKQWRRHPSELDASVCGRIPLRTNRDDRYLSENFQALPKEGYTKLFENLLAKSPGITLKLGMSFAEAKAKWRYKHLIFTGALDEFYSYQFGPLPYRSLRFEHQSFSADELKAREPVSGKPGFWQSAMQINYPDREVPFTRIVEIKHATGQQTEASNTAKEFPKDWTLGEEPYYPVPAPDARETYQRYAELANLEKTTTFTGRLATYRYYNMDQVTGMALAEAEKLIKRLGIRS